MILKFKIKRLTLNYIVLYCDYIVTKRKEMNTLENKVAILNIASFLTSSGFDELVMELEAHTICEVMIKTDGGYFKLDVAGIDVDSFE